MIDNPRMECVQGSRDLFKFWEISGNIPEMVQERHIVAIQEIACGLSNGTITGDL